MELVSSAIQTNSRKRKRASTSKDKPSKKRTLITYKDKEISLNGCVLKPGDVVSVNPERSKDEFWLAEVVTVVNKSRVNVKWLEKSGKRYKYCYGALGTVDPLALNGFGGGEWLSDNCYFCK